MSVRIYPKAAQKLWEGEFHWVNNTFKVALLDNSQAYDEAHEFYDDLSGVVGTPEEIESRTNLLGVLDAANTVFNSLTGNPVYKLVIFKDTGVASTSPVVFYIDAGIGLPFTPVAGITEIPWDNGPNKIARTAVA